MRVTRSISKGCLAVFLALACLPPRTFGEKPEIKMQPFPLSRVRLSDGYWKDEAARMQAYLRELEPDRLLYSFRELAGLDSPGKPYGGWEMPPCEVRGHFAGHFLSACAMMYAGADDAGLKSKADAMVAELAKCQAALGGEYLSAFPESFWERLESGQAVWAPYYTIHKMMAGLYDMYTLCGNAQALEVLKGMAAYFKKRLDKLPNDAMDRILRVEFGGMSEVLHNLYSVTRDPQYLAPAHRFDQPEFLGPLALEYDNLTRIHGNTQIPKVIGAARRYELTGDARYRDLAAFFWERVVNTRTYATGGSTMFEIWPEPNRLADTLGHLNHETCKTYNMLRLTRHLLCWTGDAAYGDFYERALLNGILGTQGPEPGQLQYYVAMAAGYPRVFGTPDNSFWCCYGTGIESFSKLGDSIYFHAADQLYVNLFIPSALDWREEGVRVEQRTGFPWKDTVELRLNMERPGRFAIHIRIPYWTAAAIEATVNGAPVATQDARPSSWLTLEREWKDSDRVNIRLPMALHTLSLPDDAEMVSVLYGPVVLAGILEEVSTRQAYVEPANDGIFLYPQSFPPLYIEGAPDLPGEWLKPVPGEPLAFAAPGQPRIKKLVPFYKIVAERYGLYWPVVKKGSARYIDLQRAESRWRREIDRVFIYPNDSHPKSSERQHQLKQTGGSAGSIPGTAFVYRHASPGGHFEWTFKAEPDSPLSLLCTYWGGDVGRTFDILVNGQLLKTEQLNNLGPGRLVDVEYAVPKEWSAGKDTVTVAFRANHDTMAGGVFGCAVLRADGR